MEVYSTAVILIWKLGSSFYLEPKENSLTIAYHVKLSEGDHLNPDVTQEVIYRMLLEAVYLLLPSLLI